jgi:hypothetical protein
MEKEDGDSIGQVEREGDASQIGSPCGRSAKDLKASRLGGRSDTLRHRGGRVAATRRWMVLVVRASKHHGGWFPGLEP